jgi:two-component system sensor histidine kinase MprB
VTFRRRIALLAGLSFVAAVIACSFAGYLTARRELPAVIDRDLLSRANDPLSLGLTTRASGRPDPVPGYPPGRPNRRGNPPQPLNQRPRVHPTDVFSQVVTPDGTVTVATDQPFELPVDDEDRAIAKLPDGHERYRDVTINDEHYEMITASTGSGEAIMVARSLTEVDTTLRTLGLILVVVLVAGAIVAAGVGWWVARRAARPVLELSRAAERVTATLDLETLGEVDLPSARDDEIARLGRSMTEMVDALRRSRAQQHQLVLDAGHELRTPLTSLRTNVGLLDHPDLDPETRAALVADIRAEVVELTNLSIELVELASDRHPEERPTVVAVDELIDRVAERARKRSGQTIVVGGTAWTMTARAGQLERAVQNLVDNATKWNPPSQPIEVTSSPGEIRVRDHGPGVAEAERELVFERFYRSDAARTTPGSGLGLAIVRQIVAGHGGTVRVEQAVGGGAELVVRFDAIAAGPVGR